MQKKRNIEINSLVSEYFVQNHGEIPWRIHGSVLRVFRAKKPRKQWIFVTGLQSL